MTRFELRDLRIALWLAVFLTAVFVSIASGRLSTMDDQTQYYLLEALWKTGSPAIDIPDEIRHLNTSQGIDGRRYSYYGIGGALLFFPFFAAGKTVTALFGGGPYVVQACMSLINAFVTPLSAAVLFLLLRTEGFSRRASLRASLLYSLATVAFVWSKYQYNSVFTGFSFAAALLLLSSSSPLRSVCAGALLGWAFNVRYDAALGAAVLFLLPLARRRYRDAAFLTLGLIPFLLLALWYNDYRFGTPWETGYFKTPTQGGFHASPIESLPGLLLLPNRGLLWYSPVFLLLPWGLARLSPRRAVTLVSYGALPVIYLSFFSTFVAWDGGAVWGPRYLACLFPLIAVAFAAFPEHVSPWMRRAAIVTIALSFLIQLWGSSVNVDSYYDFLVERGINPAEAATDARLTPLLGISEISSRFRFEAVPLGETRGLLPSGGHPATVSLRFTPDYWPFYAWRIGVNPVLLFLLWCVPAGIAAFSFRPILAELREGSPPE